MITFRGSKNEFAKAVLCSAIFSSLLSLATPSFADEDPVVFSFATVGDTRQDPTKADPTTLIGGPAGTLLPQDAHWLQNTKAWARILRTVQAQKANLLLVNGDMIMGYGRATVPAAWGTAVPAVSDVVSSDLVNFYKQYAYWRGMTANSMETGTYVIPVPGNHEVQCSDKVSILNKNSDANKCASGKHAYEENESAWRANMGDLIDDLKTNARFESVAGVAAQNVSGLTGDTAPNASTDSGITTDQSYLSYSFDIQTSNGGPLLHFAVINTDAVGFDTHAPTGWLAADFAAAKSRGAAQYFVFGHKPAFTYNYTNAATIAPGGLDALPAARDTFWGVIAEYNATYFCGHEHTYHIGQFADPTGTYRGNPYQVLVGSGGSPFDAVPTVANGVMTVPPLAAKTDRDYAWAVVRVHQSGAVSLDAYGFDDTFGPTKRLAHINLSGEAESAE